MSRVYETAIKIAASISKNFKSDTQAAAKALSQFAGASKATQAAVTAAKTKYNTVAEALRRLEAAEKAAGGATKESTKWRKAGERALAATSRELDRATKAAERNAQANRKANVEAIKAAKIRLFGEADKTPLFQKAGQQIRGLARDAAVLGTVAVGVGVGLYKLVERTAELGDGAVKMSKRIGIGIEALQEIRYVGQRSGIAVEGVDHALGKMSQTIGKFKNQHAKGNNAIGGAIPGLEALNAAAATEGAASFNPFKVLQLDAKALAQLKPDEQLVKIAEAFSKLKTDADRSAVSTALFGREAGIKMVAVLKEGSAGLAKLRQEARATGGVLSEQAAKDAEKFRDAQIDAEMAAGGLANTLGAALLPTVTQTFREFSAWVRSNRAEIQRWVGDAAKWIQTKGIPALKDIARGAKDFAIRMAELAQGASRLVGGFGNLAIVLAGVRLAPLAVTMAKISLTTFKAADGLFKYAEAAKAAKAAGGVSQVELSAGGKALGVAASAAMLAQAAAIGWAIGRALDDYFGLSNKIVNFARNISGQNEKEANIVNTAAEINRIQLQRKEIERDTKVRQLQAQGRSYGQALFEANHPGEASAPESGTVRNGGGRGSVHVAPIVHIHEASSRKDVADGMDKAKQHALEAWDKREQNRKRVAFGK